MIGDLIDTVRNTTLAVNEEIVPKKTDRSHIQQVDVSIMSF